MDYNISEGYNYEIKNINIKQNGQNIIFYINYPNNLDNLNTGKIQNLIKNGEINFYEKASNYNYKISQYKVQSISQGCNFNLETNTNIYYNNNISLIFEEINRKSNYMNTNCILSSNNNNQIKCSLNNEINNTYTLKDFIFYDENELYTIFLNNKSSNYSLLCLNSIKSNNSTSIGQSSESGSSSIKTIIYIVGPILLIALSFVVIYCLCRNKKPVIKENPISVLETNPNIQSKDHLEESKEEQFDLSNNIKEKTESLMKVLFETTTGFQVTIFIDKKKTVKDLIMAYLRKVERPDLFNKNDMIRFLFNATKIDCNSKEEIEKFMSFSPNGKITVIDLKQLIGDQKT